jgi:enamine deaminase RidA (YjgF/YER057c/UK114 family)
MTVNSSAKKFVSVPELEDSSMFGYSQCLTLGDNIYVAGQCGLGPDHEIVSPEFEPQARAAIERVRAGLEAAGGSLDDVVAMTVFVTDIRYGREFTKLRREYFREPYPTSALIGVSALMPLGALIEIQVRAVKS